MGACCPNLCYAHSNSPGKQFLPLDSSTLLPAHPLSWVPGFAPLPAQCEILMDTVLSVVICKFMYD